MLAYLSIKIPNAIIYCSEYTRKVHEKLGFKAENTYVIENGIDLNRFRPSVDLRNKFRNEIGVNNKLTLIGIIARYSPIKGYDVFIEMASKLLNSEKNIQFILVGTGVDQNNTELTSELRKHSLTEHVHLLGERKDIETIMNGLDVLVCPSYSESFGLVVIEALACDTPVVCSELGALHNIVDNEYLVPVGNADEFANRVKRILGTSKPDRNKLISKGKELVLNNYSYESMNKQYLDIYQSMLSLN
jgi:glycosyltransferase involved in cell wall biosynthesis